MTEFFPWVSAGRWTPGLAKCTFPTFITCYNLLLKVRSNRSCGGIGEHQLPYSFRWAWLTHPSFFYVICLVSDTPRPLTLGPVMDSACKGHHPRLSMKLTYSGDTFFHLYRSGTLLSGLSCGIRLTSSVHNTNIWSRHRPWRVSPCMLSQTQQVLKPVPQSQQVAGELTPR